MRAIPVLLLLACLAPWAPAQDKLPAEEEQKQEQELEAAPAPPDIPPPVQSGQPIEPEVTIIRKKEAVIEEYRINGILYMVKVTPDVGKPYYLIDRDGDGNMETRQRGIREDPGVPQWILFSW